MARRFEKRVSKTVAGINNGCNPTPRKILELIENKQDELSGRKIKIPTPDLSRELGNLLKTGAFNDFYGIRDGEKEMISPPNSLNNWFNTVSVATNSDGTGIDLQMSYLILPELFTNLVQVLHYQLNYNLLIL